jgi:nucleotide-binding universal stress UspA family protein
MTVAVAHSDTEQGRAALRRAAAEADLRGESLAVLRIVPGPTDPHTEVAGIEEQVRALLAGHHPDLELTVHTAAEGHDTAGSLVDLATEIDSSLLVIGSRRRSPVGKLLLGSTVQRVLLDAPMAVLVVKADAPAT